MQSTRGYERRRGDRACRRQTNPGRRPDDSGENAAAAATTTLPSVTEAMVTVSPALAPATAELNAARKAEGWGA